MVKNHKDVLRSDFISASAGRVYIDEYIIKELKKKYDIFLASIKRNYKMSAVKELIYRVRSVVEAKISELKESEDLINHITNDFLVAEYGQLYSYWL